MSSQRNSNRGNGNLHRNTEANPKESQAAVVKEPEAVEESELDDSFLPQKNAFRIDEAARYFDVSDRTIRLWVEHGHLQAERVVGSIRITRNSMLNCRFGTSAAGRMRI